MEPAVTEAPHPPTWFGAVDRFNNPLGARRVAIFIDLLRQLPTGRMIDLGTGHGLFARIAADFGWEVVGLDARDERFPDDPRVSWVVGDAAEYDLDGFDLVVCLGLWYHMTHDAQVRLAERAVPRTLIVDTHISFPGRDAPRGLSDITRIGEDLGRLYYEGDFQDIATASKGNDWSFWPTEDSLLSMLTRCGYDSVETYFPRVSSDRRFYLARTFSDDERRYFDTHVPHYASMPSPRPPVPWQPTDR